MTRPNRIIKTLTANDVGETGGHQAGILVPKDPEILSFFPPLNSKEKNPRIRLLFRESDEITRWEFAFIYYNNRFFGGTRNEYRLTCMTKYLRSVNAKVGQNIALSRDSEDRLFIDCLKEGTQSDIDDDVLCLSGGWKIISTN